MPVEGAAFSRHCLQKVKPLRLLRCPEPLKRIWIRRDLSRPKGIGSACFPHFVSLVCRLFPEVGYPPNVLLRTALLPEWPPMSILAVVCQGYEVTPSSPLRASESPHLEELRVRAGGS